MRRSVVAVSEDPGRPELLDVLVDADDFEVVVVETIARGYSRIKEIVPDLVIVFSHMNDLAACRLLTMLKVDGQLAGIPVVTCATGAM